MFAKVSPAQKARVIEALHLRGHVVGYLGDGINDGPALKAADVGISVDTAVDIAKESADIILLEKSLSVLHDGAIEGRKVFGNIVKYIKMGASSNFGNMFSVLGASIFLPFLPMLPIQVLTNNLLYDFSQTTIPTDNVDEEYLAVPRQWDIGNLTRFVLLIGPISSIFDYLTFFMMIFMFGAWNNPGPAQPVPGRLVRRIAADPDPDHPHHPHRPHPVPTEPRQHAADRDHDPDRVDRRHHPLHEPRHGARFQALALALLAPGDRHDGDLRGHDPPGEKLVRAPLGDVGPQRRP